MPATCCFRCFSMLYIWMMCVCECMSVHLLMRYGHCWILAPWGVITEEIFWPLSLISVNMERNCRTSVCMSNTQNTHRGLCVCVRVRSAEANAMTSAWKHMVHFFCRMSISAIASVCVCICLCVFLLFRSIWPEPCSVLQFKLQVVCLGLPLQTHH